MPQQPDHSRFRPEDLTTRPVSSFRDLDAITMYVDYLLMRIGEQREEVERKLVAFEATNGPVRFARSRTTIRSCSPGSFGMGRSRQCSNLGRKAPRSSAGSATCSLARACR